MVKMKENIVKVEDTTKLFDNIKHIDENGVKYWEARELQGVLDYKVKYL